MQSKKDGLTGFTRQVGVNIHRGADEFHLLAGVDPRMAAGNVRESSDKPIICFIIEIERTHLGTSVIYIHGCEVIIAPVDRIRGAGQLRASPHPWHSFLHRCA